MGLFSSEFDNLVTEATSEYLPAAQEDLAKNLEICDLIKSRQVPSKNAMRTIKDRLLHRNPNVQLLALSVGYSDG
jgi:growth factor-regulated tyrosine kinase substrate